MIRKLTRFQISGLIILFSASLLIRICCCIPALCNPERLTRPDTGSYVDPAESLAVTGRWNESADSATPATLRPILYPAFLAASMKVFGREREKFYVLSALTGCLLSALTVIPIMLCAGLIVENACFLLAGCFYALNLTSIASAPLILTDTLLGFICACGILFLFRAAYLKSILNYLIGFSFFVLGLLVKPVNLPLVCVYLPFVLAPILLHERKKVMLSLFFSLLITGVFLGPFLYRNHSIGAGWSLELNGGNTFYYHNGAAILAYCTGENAEVIRARMMADAEKEIQSDPEKFSFPKAKNDFLMQKAFEIIKQHPFASMRVMFFQPLILLPDMPVFLENNGISRDGSGTLAILHQKGFIAAVDHYLHGRWHLLLLPLPFLIVCTVLYVCCMGCLLLWIRFRRWKELSLFLIAAYYLVSPGPVLMPRYQIPALSILCCMGGFYGAVLLHNFKSRVGRKQSRVPDPANPV